MRRHARNLFCDLPRPVVFIAVLAVQQNDCPVARAAPMSDALKDDVNLPIMAPLHGPNVGARRRVAPSGFEAPARVRPVR
ncbi:protein of unknown function [Burkholderia multivorans]